MKNKIDKDKVVTIILLLLIALSIICILFIYNSIRQKRHLARLNQEKTVNTNAIYELEKIKLSTKDLEESMHLQGEWFIKNQTTRGDFIYEREVETGDIVEGYNDVRQAGSLYALAQLYKYSKNEDLEKTVQRGINFFKVYAEPQEGSPSAIAINFKGSTKSNTVALFLLAIIEYMEASEEAKEEHLEFAEQLANYLVTTQLDSGGYVYKYYTENDAEEPYKESDYNNGETFYALLRMYKLTGNETYLESANKAAPYLIEKYGSEGINLSFYAWGMEGFAHLYDIDPKEEYWEFLKSYTNKYLVAHGNKVATYFLNEYQVNPPKGNLGVYMEGLAHVAWIAKEKDPEYYDLLKIYMENSLDYLLSLQVDGPKTERTSDNDFIKGGSCYDYFCDTMRIDIVHHILSGNYLYLTLVK